MRAALRVALGLAALAALAVGALALWLPRLVTSDAFQVRLREAVRDATGREASWRALEFGLLPPRVALSGARLGDASAPEGPPLAVERAELELALLPLLARAVVVDRVEIAGVAIRLVRTAEGVRLAGAAAAPSAGGARGGPERAAEEPAGSGDTKGGLRFAVRRLELREGSAVLEDRTASPPVRLELRDAAGRARAAGLATPIEVTAEGALVSGGGLRVEGEIAPAGALDLALAVEDVELAPLVALVPAVGTLTGRASGTLRLRGPTRAPDALDAELELADAGLALREVTIRGPVSVHAELRGALARPAGTFSIEATRAELLYGGGAFRKPPGAPARAEGRLATGAGGRVAVESLRLQVKNLDGAGRFVPTARGGALALEAPPFELAGWGELVPALAPLAPQGRLALSGTRASWAPLALGGRVVLDGVRLRPGGRGPVELRGALEARGAGLHGPDLEVAVAGQPARLSLELLSLDTDPRHHATLELRRADASALAGALAGKADAVEGPVSLDADLSGPLAGAPRALAELRGTARIEAGPGRIADLAPLEDALRGLGDVGERFAKGRRGAALRPFYTDRFESLSGSFEIGGGRARSEDLELRYPGYALALRGSVGLVDQRLDARGRLRLEPELDAALLTPDDADAPAPVGRARDLRLAHVGGTLAEPEFQIEPEAALALAAAAATTVRRDRLERKIDRALGAGAGRSVLDALDRMLGAPPEEEKAP